MARTTRLLACFWTQMSSTRYRYLYKILHWHCSRRYTIHRFSIPLSLLTVFQILKGFFKYLPSRKLIHKQIVVQGSCRISIQVFSFGNSPFRFSVVIGSLSDPDKTLDFDIRVLYCTSNQRILEPSREPTATVTGDNSILTTFVHVHYIVPFSRMQGVERKRHLKNNAFNLRY